MNERDEHSRGPVGPGHRYRRRDFLRAGMGLAAGAAAVWLPRCAAANAGGQAVTSSVDSTFMLTARPALSGLRALAEQDAQNGGSAPFPIPWLDKNGSFNQSPGPGQDPSNIFHFKGRVARANGFTGMGTDNQRRRIPFGTHTTDFSFMQGTYWAARTEQEGTFAHT
jgi:hypothetical protein